MARAAAVVGTCYPDDGVARNAAYLWHGEEIPKLWGRFTRGADCIASSGGGCAALEKCLGLVVGKPGTCTEGRRCNGSVFELCANGARSTADCSKLGLTCDPSAVCADAPLESCDARSFVPACVGAEPRTCGDGAVFHGPDCASRGLTCSAGTCVGEGAACTKIPVPGDLPLVYRPLGCQGDSLRACVGAHEHVLSCKDLDPDFGCQTVNGVEFCGLASECLPAEEPDQAQGGNLAVACEGTKLVFCSAGRIERVDCIALGFTGCDAGAKACATTAP